MKFICSRVNVITHYCHSLYIYENYNFILIIILIVSVVAPTGDHVISLVDEISFTFPPAPPISQIDDIPPEQFCNGDNRPADCGANCMCTHQVDIPHNAVVEVVLVDEGMFVWYNYAPVTQSSSAEKYTLNINSIKRNMKVLNLISLILRGFLLYYNKILILSRFDEIKSILLISLCTIDYSTTAQSVASLPLARIRVQRDRHWPFSR